MPADDASGTGACCGAGLRCRRSRADTWAVVWIFVLLGVVVVPVVVWLVVALQLAVVAMEHADGHGDSG